MKKVVLFSAAALIALSSCTHRLTDFTVISTKNVPIGNGYPTQMAKADKRVIGKDSKLMILGVSLGTPNLKQAIDNAIESHPGAIGLADGVVKTTGWYALLVGKTGYKVEGTPIYEVRDDAGTPQSSYNAPKQQQQQNGETVMFFHEVKVGETLPDIAKSYGVSVADLIKWNSLSSTDLAKGTKLKVMLR